ncbi:winged helix-turn-helix domain-containing protein [Paractinoplanes hotanensis]|uniref:Helix-turn-helix domain-containing protein n=1 Tax=Paractinoplanes hotanensis TaxID=2906497 RepID=A0ABT0XUW4_9ACTN|nr:helix-turn-helix domain-containing protein [Actinoplanes hotanensis]MCM4077574.1 helix-turn-helix domain-containing protein [Actinoplanes hotanensis]
MADESRVEKSEVVLTDAAMMRAMAHPLRMHIVGSLRLDGPATSAILARRLGTDSGQTSHHLRLLARHGFVIEAPEQGRGTHGRERWWKAAHESTLWADDADAEELAAANRASRAVYDQVIDQFHAEAAHQRWSAEWLDAAATCDYVIRTTPNGLQRLRERIVEAIREADAPEPGAETVVVVLHTYPRRGRR